MRERERKKDRISRTKMMSRTCSLSVTAVYCWMLLSFYRSQFFFPSCSSSFSSAFFFIYCVRAKKTETRVRSFLFSLPLCCVSFPHAFLSSMFFYYSEKDRQTRRTRPRTYDSWFPIRENYYPMCTDGSVYIQSLSERERETEWWKKEREKIFDIDGKTALICLLSTMIGMKRTTWQEPLRADFFLLWSSIQMTISECLLHILLFDGMYACHH